MGDLKFNPVTLCSHQIHTVSLIARLLNSNLPVLPAGYAKQTEPEDRTLLRASINHTAKRQKNYHLEGYWVIDWKSCSANCVSLPI